MDDIRICGNGHLFPFKAGTCPACDSLASRPATRLEVDAGEVVQPDPAAPPRARRPVPQAEDKLEQYFLWGIGLILLSGVIAIVAAGNGSAAGVVLSCVIGLIGFVIVLIGVIAVGVREGLDAYVTKTGIDLDQLSGRVRPPS